MTSMHDLIASSRSYRSFDRTRPVTCEELLAMVDCARLSPSAVNRQPLTFKVCTSPAECDAILPLTKWAGMLTDRTMPPRGHEPTAYLVICLDTRLCPEPSQAFRDVGIACQSILLCAAEMGLGGCIIGAFDADGIARDLAIPADYRPLQIVALGKPDETVRLTDVGDDGRTAYYRDENDVHVVPKRKLEDILL